MREPAVNNLELVSVKDSKITSVSVYSGRAEITRLFKFNVKSGQNQLSILGLPKAMDQESFRVEGRGAASIHDVSISTIIPPPTQTTSSTLTALLAKQKQTEKALARTQKALSSLETYLSSVSASHVDPAKLRDVVQTYDATAGDLDNKVTELENELKELESALEAEKDKLSGSSGNEKLNLKASVAVFADFDGEIDIALIYAVYNATWCAGYDIRVDMHTKEKPINLVYKGSITQDTGEDWDDVPLTLETAIPTFGVGVPTLTPWTLSVYQPPVIKKKSILPTNSRYRPSFSQSFQRAGFAEEAMSVPDMQYHGLHVSSKGNVNATFSVPGLISIPSDNVGHNVTIAKLALNATMSWICVPKKDVKVHLKAKIKNASEYTLLPGTSSVYVDGSFISKSEVPLVSPDESFDCPLGLDPSIRVTYHPQIKKTSHSGFYNKSSVHTYMQRILVHNTKSAPAGSSNDTLKIKVVEQVPISEDSMIAVKLLQPPLALPGADGSGSGTISASGADDELKLPAAIKVSSGVVANWDGADEISLGSVQGQNDVDIESLGRDGRFCWICSVPYQGKVNLILQWEVSAPLRTDILGL